MTFRWWRRSKPLRVRFMPGPFKDFVGIDGMLITDSPLGGQACKRLAAMWKDGWRPPANEWVEVDAHE